MPTSNVEKLSQKALMAYLHRIKLHSATSELAPTLSTLQVLHRQHALHIPFEALSIHIDAKVSQDAPLIPLSLVEVFNKLVQAQRGGYCYEMNKLFAAVLCTLGFEVYSHKASVLWGQMIKPAPRHRMLTVKIGEAFYLADVGFGGPGQIDLLKLTLNEPQIQGNYVYRLILDGEGDFELQKQKIDGEWMRLYAFDQKVTYRENDYLADNEYVSTSQESSFVQKMICTMPRENGRVTLVDNTLKIDVHRQPLEQISLETVFDYVDALDQHFGIHLPADTTFIRHHKQLLFSDSLSVSQAFMPEASRNTPVVEALISQQIKI